MKVGSFLSLVMLIWVIPSFAQTGGSNPFDLKYRSGEKIVSLPDTVQTIIETTIESNESQNPFDLKRSGSKLDVKEEPPQVIIKEVFSDSKGINKNFYFWLLIFLTLLFAVVINLNRGMLPRLLKAWSNLNFSNLLLRDRRSQDRVLYALLALIFYINAAVFIGGLLTQVYAITVDYKLLMMLFIGVVAVYLIRHSCLFFIQWLFTIGKEVGQYSFSIHLFNILSGIVLLLANFLIVFAPSGVSLVVIYLIVFVLFVQFIYRNIRGLVLGAGILSNNKIHFFLYLCSCEIAPWVLGYIALTRMA